MEGSPNVDQIRAQVEKVFERARQDSEFRVQVEADPPTELRKAGIDESAIEEASRIVARESEVSAYRWQDTDPRCDLGTCIISIANCWISLA